MKKLLLLGGSRYLLPVIERAHKKGCYVITCDYLPDNFAHKYADEYVNASIIDKDKVLAIARQKKIDGVMSFACDPGVVTAAYVAEMLQLPRVADYEAVCILQNKDLFRKFLYENGFNVPKAKGFSTPEEALKKVDMYNWPIIVKPVDSAGSKGVTRVDSKDKLISAIKKAFKVSISKRIIIEEFIESLGDPTDCDCFSINGDMRCVAFSGQKFDPNAENPYTPAGFVFPSDLEIENQQAIALDLQKLCDLLDLQTSIYNVEARVGKDGKVYLMEVSPRGGGNRLSEMIFYSTGIDLIDASICAALGEKVERVTTPICKGFWYEHILHSNKNGKFKSVEINDDLMKFLIEKDIWLKNGDNVSSFTGANETIGTLVFKFPTKEIMDEVLKKITTKIEVVVE